MGLVLDTSILIAEERGKFDMPGFLRSVSVAGAPFISSITASELLHGVERAIDPSRKLWRSQHVEQILLAVPIIPFDLAQARVHARIWADLERRGQMIGAHDLVISAAALALGFELGTVNVAEFNRVSGLQVRDASAFLRK